MKRKAINKLISLGLAGILAAGLMTGCGNSDDKPSDTGSSQSGADNQSSAGSEEGSGQEGNSGATSGAAANGISLPEIPDGVLKLEVSIPDFNQTSEGTMIQNLWQIGRASCRERVS